MDPESVDVGLYYFQFYATTGYETTTQSVTVEIAENIFGLSAADAIAAVENTAPRFESDPKSILLTQEQDAYLLKLPDVIDPDGDII